MCTVEISFTYPEGGITEHMFERIDDFIAALRMNGQIYASVHPSVWREKDVLVYAYIPEVDGLNPKYYNDYCRKYVTELRGYGLSGPHVRILDELDYEAEDDSVCRCVEASSYILYKDFLSLTTPIICGSCRLPVPLYRLPPTASGEYNDIISWQTNYEACGNLYLNDAVAQHAVTRELRHAQSSLNQQGRRICANIEQLTGIPTYCYIYQSLGRERRRDKDRYCPICGELWVLEEAWNRFDTRCDKDRIVGDLPFIYARKR